MKTIKKGSYKRIHVNGSLLRQKMRGTKAKKPYVIRTSDKERHAGRVDILGPSRLIYSRRGTTGTYRAYAWIGTFSEVKYV